MKKDRSEYLQNYSKNNYKQLNVKISAELYDELTTLKNEYGSFPKVLEMSLDALNELENYKKDNENLQIEFKNLQIKNNDLEIKNNNLEKNILELKSKLNENINANFNNKKEESFSDNKLVLEVIDENEKLKNELVQLKNYNAELKNNLDKKVTYNASENKNENNKLFIFLIGVIGILLFVNFINIFKF